MQSTREGCGYVTITTYRNFDLLITRSGDSYRAFAVDAPEGEAS